MDGITLSLLGCGTGYYEKHGFLELPGFRIFRVSLKKNMPSPGGIPNVLPRAGKKGEYAGYTRISKSVLLVSVNELFMVLLIRIRKSDPGTCPAGMVQA